MEILTKIDDFFFNLPLYATVELPADLSLHVSLYGHPAKDFRPTERIDGYCPDCSQSATFEILPASCPYGTDWDNVLSRVALDRIQLRCTRNKWHYLYFHFKINGLKLTKFGQLPSLADIANDEAATYRSILNKEDAAELHKAIGLAAHGIGIGSFVYLRRVFERLVNKRFEEFKVIENWDEEEFRKSRMNERVGILKDHVPAFLFENREIYSILSLGIHELSEDACLKAFDYLKLSIKIILEEDKKKKEELELKLAATNAIRSFKG